MHICVSKLTIIGSDNGLSPGPRQAIIWTNDGILLIWNFGTNFNEILSEINIFSFNKMYFIQENVFENVVNAMAAILSRPQCIKPLKYVIRNLYIQTRHRELFCALHIYKIFMNLSMKWRIKIGEYQWWPTIMQPHPQPTLLTCLWFNNTSVILNL